MQPAVLDKTLKTARIISGAMMASLLIYILIAEFLISSFGDFSFPELSILRLVLYILSGIEVVVIILFRRLLLQGAGKLPATIMNNLKQRYPNMSSTKDDPEITFCQRLLTTTIISFAISESIAIYGLVLFILGKQRQDLYLLAGLSLFLMFIFFPSSDRWRSQLEQFQRNSTDRDIG